MYVTALKRTLLIGAGVLIGVQPTAAQDFEAVGTRAQGMAGAFVAVADDATATWWNPAGLATGAFFSMAMENGRATLPADAPPDGPAARYRSRGFAAAFPALGLSYYRLRISEIRRNGPTGAELDGRQEEGAAGIGLRAGAASQYGVTLGQSIGNHLVIASTLKLVRAGLGAGEMARADTETAGDGLSRAEDLSVDGGTEGDLDLGVMAAVGVWRAGAVVKHVREPTFTGANGTLRLERQARAGVALVTRGAGALQGLVAAVDADLTRTSTVDGDVRRVAAGLEGWVLNRSVGLRGGVSANTVGEARTSFSAGGSIAARSGVYLDGAWTFGEDEGKTGWNVGVRVAF